ncbi:MAG: glycosyltransferase family 2 protein [Anaerolineales bacterium]|nr:glycosyltransferase family 2 protein [Anaerolineales bacterium]
MNSLSIVIPAYNEAANIAGVLQSVSATALKLNMDYEIILVNDGSQDQTGILARELGSYIPNFRLVEHYPNRGYGGALKAGFAAAAKEWIAFIPGDGQFDFAEIRRLIDRASEADIICGYRANRQDPFLRKVNAFGWNTLIRLLFGRLCRDIDCGFKLIRAEVLTHVNLESNGAMVDTELLAAAKARGYRITEVPVTHLPRTAGESTGADLKVIFKAFRDLLAFRLRLNREIVQTKAGSTVTSSSTMG